MAAITAPRARVGACRGRKPAFGEDGPPCGWGGPNCQARLATGTHSRAPGIADSHPMASGGGTPGSRASKNPSQVCSGYPGGCPTPPCWDTRAMRALSHTDRSRYWVNR